ncbi:hypothetical protein F4821DRAFT_238146 [Hypoxylon rubiginosum]|uniref:Uncharacterized protein n=1 Tax=Hypoxylon rubiginosum TaxID=110542 RepID=A0ACC0D2N2_9PEZI|nr:hypothetical protein F4821DRAFT_238146 [Hypoxylon rubiginosum]
MTDASIFRFPIWERDNEYLLLEVSSNGSRPLDLKLVGSEGTAVFTMKLRHKRFIDYKAPNAPCSTEEWEEILTSILVNQQPAPDIEIRADIQSDSSSVTLSFRKNIQGITQKLGSFTLEEDEKTEISPFDWCVLALGSREKVQDNLASTNLKISKLEDSLKELQGHLDDLIKAKEEDETQLLEKFRDLLNEKKVKIRQQQRLLASSNVDPEKLANVSGGQSAQRRTAQASRSAKRKVKEEPESSDDGFDRMDVDEENDNDNAQEEGGGHEDQGETTADETVSGTDSDDDPAPLPVKSRRNQAAASTPSSKAASEEDSPPPPKRGLPYMKKPAAPATKPVDDDETEPDEE